jgi:hypothetical protein
MTNRSHALNTSNVSYRKPSVHDKGALEQLTKRGDPGGDTEPEYETLIWADPFTPQPRENR